MGDRGWRAAPPGGLLYLDLATVSGWAYGTSQDGGPRYGAVELPSYDQTGATMAATYEMVADLIEFYRPRRLINEGPLVTNYRDRHGVLQHVVSNDKAISCLRGMIEVSRCVAFHFRVSTGEFDVQTVRTVMRGFPAYDRRSEKARLERSRHGMVYRERV